MIKDQRKDVRSELVITMEQSGYEKQFYGLLTHFLQYYKITWLKTWAVYSVEKKSSKKIKVTENRGRRLTMDG